MIISYHVHNSQSINSLFSISDILLTLHFT